MIKWLLIAWGVINGCLIGDMCIHLFKNRKGKQNEHSGSSRKDH